MIFPSRIYNVAQQLIQWTYVVRNSGNTTAYNVVSEIIDLPSNVEILSYTIPKGSFILADKKWYIGNLDRNEEVRILLTFVVNEPIEDITFISSTYATQSIEINGMNNTISETVPFEMITRGNYRSLLINVGKQTEEFSVNYTLENTIGEYNITNGAEGIYSITFPNEPELDGSFNMYVAVHNIITPTTTNTLEVWEYYGNQAFFNILSLDRVTIANGFYEAFIEVRFY